MDNKRYTIIKKDAYVVYDNIMEHDIERIIDHDMDGEGLEKAKALIEKLKRKEEK